VEGRRQLRTEYGDLFDAAAALPFRDDPIGISFDNPNTDEYETEGLTVLSRLSGCRSSDKVLRVVREEFGRWFGTDTAGPLERYTQIACRDLATLARSIYSFANCDATICQLPLRFMTISV
jgi:hypothetical protein